MVVDNFWQTEIAAPVLGTLPTFEARPGKVGKPLPGVAADVVDKDGKSLPDGHGGLLVLRRPCRTCCGPSGATTRATRSTGEQIPGCYTCGDIAVRDHDGYFAVLGRSDDVMNVAGHRIGTADVEGSLLRHPAVAESAVIGLPDPIKGERIKAFVVLKASAQTGAGLIGQPQGPRAPGPRPHRRAAEIDIVASLPRPGPGRS
jgi:acetyl-CoA synthetase